MQSGKRRKSVWPATGRDRVSVSPSSTTMEPPFPVDRAGHDRQNKVWIGHRSGPKSQCRRSRQTARRPDRIWSDSLPFSPIRQIIKVCTIASLNRTKGPSDPHTPPPQAIAGSVCRVNRVNGAQPRSRLPSTQSLRRGVGQTQSPQGRTAISGSRKVSGI